jgi:hypothetical protein
MHNHENLYCYIDNHTTCKFVTIKQHMMATPRITLYFDIGSPFSQIGFHVLRVLKTHLGDM